RKAADWGEDEFDVLSPQDAAAAADRIEALEAENFKLAAGACNVEGGLIGDDHGHVYCSLKARIEALERELAEGWQDIATAPKDGTRVIVYSTTDTPHYADQDYVATVLQGEHVE